MRVLVLRPEPAAGRTAARLAARGHEAVLLPLSQAEHDTDAASAGLAGPHAAIAITSAEAARVLAGLGDASAPHRATPLFAVGRASAEAARRAGFQTVFDADGDGDALAALIAGRPIPSSPASPLLYLAGTPRASGFETGLRQAGIPFRTVETYRMVPLLPTGADWVAALRHPEPDAVLLYSRESARAFFALATLPANGRLRFLCMSPNVVAAVPQGFAHRTAIAAKPDEDSLLALL